MRWLDLEKKGRKQAKIREIKSLGIKLHNPIDDSGHLMIIGEFQDSIGCNGKARDKKRMKKKTWMSNQ